MRTDTRWQDFLAELTEEEKAQAREMYEVVQDNEYDPLDDDAMHIVIALWNTGFRKVVK